MELEYARQIFEKSSILNSLEIRPVEAGFFHTDRRKDERTDRHARRQTDITKPKDAFLSYAHAAKNSVPTSRKGIRYKNKL
jgi:hypothetical protein